MRPRKLEIGSTARCTLGCSLLDKLLRGGVICGNITEFVGEASAAKTQACLQLLVTCQWSKDKGGLGGKALYVYTEGDPSIKRLMALTAHSAHKASLESVYWERDVVDGQDLLDRLKHAEHIMRQPQTTPLRLLIVDSIAHLFRDVGDKPQIAAFAQRTGILFRISALLRRFADTYNLAVVVTNQVMDAFTDEPATSKAPACKHTGGLRLMSKGRELQPALGLAWANCINTRIFLSKTDFVISTTCLQQGRLASVSQPATLPLRCMQIVFSPCLPQDSCLYVVSQQGLQGIDPAQLADGDIQRCQYEADQASGDEPEQRPASCQTNAATSSTGQGMQSSTIAVRPEHTALQCRTNAELQDRSSNPDVSKKQHCAIATGVFASD